MCNDSVLQKQVFLNMNIANVCVMETGCKDRDYAGKASCSEGINLEGA